MSSKLNIWRIFSDHAGTLKNYRTKKTAAVDWFVFFGIPIIASSGLFAYRWHPSEPFLQGALAALSIITGLMFSILVLLYDFRRRNGVAPDEQELEEQRLQELYFNVSYMILVGLVGAMALALGLAIHDEILDASIGALLLHAFLTLLMLLKRIHILLDPIS